MQPYPLRGENKEDNYAGWDWSSQYTIADKRVDVRSPRPYESSILSILWVAYLKMYRL